MINQEDIEYIQSSLIAWYDIKRQGCTNESMKSNPVLKDLSGNGHDATCYNFAWSGNSGIGGVAEDFLSSYYMNFLNGSRGRGTVTYNTIHITEVLSNSVNIRLFEAQKPLQNVKSYKIKVSGLEPGKSLLYSASKLDGQTATTFVTIEHDGEYELPEVDITTHNNIGFRTVDWYGTCNITIEQLPLYPNALVSDGVDDYAQVTGLPILTKERGYTVIAKRDNLYQLNEKGIVASKHNGSNYGAFLIEYNFNNVNATVWSFGRSNTIQISSSEIIYQTSKSYNGETSLNIGTFDDTSILDLFKYINQYFGKVVLYSFLLFDRDLTDAEIEWVKKNMVQDTYFDINNIYVYNNKPIDYLYGSNLIERIYYGNTLVMSRGSLEYTYHLEHPDSISLDLDQDSSTITIDSYREQPNYVREAVQITCESHPDWIESVLIEYHKDANIPRAVLTINISPNESQSTRTGVITIKQEKSGKTSTINLTQSAATITYGPVIIDSFIYDNTNIEAEGGTANPTVTYHQTWGYNGNETGGGVITSGASLQYSGEHVDTYTGVVTLPSKGSTISDQTSITASVRVTLNGKEAIESVTIYQEANNIESSSAIDLTYTYDGDIPASGGSIMPTINASYTNTYTSGTVETSNDIDIVGFTTSPGQIDKVTGEVSADSLGTTLKDRTSIAYTTMTYKKPNESTTYQAHAEVYQEANTRESTSITWDEYQVNYYPSIGSSGLIIIDPYTQVNFISGIERYGQQNYKYTSGATDSQPYTYTVPSLSITCDDNYPYSVTYGHGGGTIYVENNLSSDLDFRVSIMVDGEIVATRDVRVNEDRVTSTTYEDVVLELTATPDSLSNEGGTSEISYTATATKVDTYLSGKQDREELYDVSDQVELEITTNPESKFSLNETTVTVESNEGEEDLVCVVTGTVLDVEDTVEITLKKKEDYLYFQSKSAHVGEDGDNGTGTYNKVLCSPDDRSWVIVSTPNGDYDNVTISGSGLVSAPMVAGTGSKEFKISVPANTTAYERSWTLHLLQSDQSEIMDTLTITQDAASFVPREITINQINNSLYDDLDLALLKVYWGDGNQQLLRNAMNDVNKNLKVTSPDQYFEISIVSDEADDNYNGTIVIQTQETGAYIQFDQSDSHVTTSQSDRYIYINISNLQYNTKLNLTGQIIRDLDMDNRALPIPFKLTSTDNREL